MPENVKKPAIRFAGFDDAWEQRKLDEVADVRDGTHDSPHYFQEGHPFVTSKNVKDGYINYNDIQYISDADFFEINKRSKVDINDILMGMIGTIGNTALVRRKPDFAIKNVALIKDTKAVYFLYLYHYLQSPIISQQLDESMDGGTQKFIALNKIRNLFISIPNKEEQFKVGGYIDKLDNLITLHQRKYDKLVSVKKSMLEKMFPKNGSDIPEIRFAGFTDPWEQREFSLFFDCSIPSNTLSRANLSFEKGEIKNVHYGDVLIKFGAYIDVKKETIPCIIHANEENYRNQFLQNGDVIMADAAEDETVGKASEIVNLGSLKVVSGLHTIVCRPREKKQPYFLGYYINSQSFHSQLLPLMQGTKVSSLSRTNLSKTYVCYPTNPKEQAQIGNFFRNVDNLITLHQRKLEKLKNVKKSMLERMFV
nr:restriction endonuclease subunit S [uncultured Sphaerochaeta sp.]